MAKGISTNPQKAYPSAESRHMAYLFVKMDTSVQPVRVMTRTKKNKKKKSYSGEMGITQTIHVVRLKL